MGRSLDVVWTGLDVDNELALGKTVVVIDVLRATTMVATLLTHGAREIIPVTDVDEARRVASELAVNIATDEKTALPPVLLAGERGGLPPEGFNLGNSPTEVTSESVKDHTVVLTTTNGTRAINRSLQADAVVTGAFVNAQAVVNFVNEQDPANLLIVCAGTNGRFSLDDALCAGLLVERLTQGTENENARSMTDSALAARMMYQHNAEKLFQAVSDCLHGKRLKGLGLENDVTFAVNVDALDVLPIILQLNGHYRLSKH